MRYPFFVAICLIALLSNACDTGFLTGTAGPISALVPVSGNSQVTAPEKKLSDPVVVQVTDEQGNPIEGAQVKWTTSDDRGFPSPDVSISDAAGRATTEWTAGRILDDSLFAHVDEAPDIVGRFSASVRVRYTAVTSGGSHACGLTSEGMAYCWGNNKFGQLGEVANEKCLFDEECARTPVPVSGQLRFTAIAAGSWGTCGITEDRRPLCWGSTAGVTQYHPTPTTVRLAPENPTAVGVGHQFWLCVLSQEGLPYCAHDHDRGMFTLAEAPFLESLTVGSLHACALTQAGEAYCWGRNAAGELGNPGIEEHEWVMDSTVAVVGGHTFTDIAAGNNFTCALTEAGQAYCWGENSSGQVGDGTFVNRRKPTPVSGGLRFKTLVASHRAVCGLLLTSGERYCWGGLIMANPDSDQWECGRCSPYPVPGVGSHVSFDLGGSHICGFQDDELLYCSGSSSEGQLGTPEGRSGVPVYGQQGTR